MTFDEWWESDEAFEFKHLTERGVAAAAWMAARMHFQAAAYDAGMTAEREACAMLCREEGEVAAEIGHERFARYADEMERKIMARSNVLVQGPAACGRPPGTQG